MPNWSFNYSWSKVVNEVKWIKLKKSTKSGKEWSGNPSWTLQWNSFSKIACALMGNHQNLGWFSIKNS